MKTEAKLKKFFKKWGWIATLYGWKFDVFYYDKADHLPRDCSTQAAATAFFLFRYLDGAIHINLENLEGKDDDALEYVVVHELTHFLLSPFDDLEDPDAAKELATTMVSRVLVRLDKSKAKK